MKLFWKGRDEDRAVQQPKHVIANGVRWTRLVAPVVWHPEPGEAITGTFLGFAERSGAHGDYRAVLLRRSDGVKSISGTMIVSLFHVVPPGVQTRIVYAGTKQLTVGKLKVFEAFIEAQAAKRIGDDEAYG